MNIYQKKNILIILIVLTAKPGWDRFNSLQKQSAGNSAFKELILKILGKARLLQKKQF